jgi:hypothetical protein
MPGKRRRRQERNGSSHAALLGLGTHVKIRHTSGMHGEVVESRGPLGPGGAQIYLVRIRRKPRSKYIELREDQLVPMSAATEEEEAARHRTTT